MVRVRRGHHQRNGSWCQQRRSSSAGPLLDCPADCAGGPGWSSPDRRPRLAYTQTSRRRVNHRLIADLPTFRVAQVALVRGRVPTAFQGLGFGCVNFGPSLTEGSFGASRAKLTVGTHAYRASPIYFAERCMERVVVRTGSKTISAAAWAWVGPMTLVLLVTCA